MASYNLFLSVVIVTHNNATFLDDVMTEIARQVSALVDDYEIVVVDNASTDGTLSTLKHLTREGGLSNIQVFALTAPVETETAAWAGIENALGDFVVVIDPWSDDPTFLATMLESATSGHDLVFAHNTIQTPLSWPARLIQTGMNYLLKIVHGRPVTRDAPDFRLFSRRVIHFLTQHTQPVLAYQQLPSTRGFTRATLSYCASHKIPRPLGLRESLDRSMRLLVATERAPMRFVTLLSLFGASSNVVYSLYVIAIALFKKDVQPGWITLSLQQSGMFFLISLVLLVLGEYILRMARLSNESPPYHIGQEFMSTHMARHEKLNIENAAE